MEAKSAETSIQPASFSTAAAIGFLLDSISIFLETSSMDLGNLHQNNKKHQKQPSPRKGEDKEREGEKELKNNKGWHNEHCLQIA